MSRTRAALAAAGIFLLARISWLVVLLIVTRDGRPRSAYSIMTRWDAQWYARIAADGYGHFTLTAGGGRRYDYAFFPLLPLLERAGHAMTGLAPVDVGLVVSWSAGATAAAGICLLGRRLGSTRQGLIWASVWACLPISAVLALSYSDGLLAALAAWGLLALLNNRWFTAGMLAAAAGFTRPTGAALVLAVMIAGLLAGARDRAWRPLLAVLLAPIGLIGFLAWVGLSTGSPTGYFDVTRGWANGFDGGASFARWLTRLLADQPLAGIAALGALLLILALVAALIRDGEPWTVVLYTGAVVAMSLTTSGYFGSKPRYLLAAFPLLLPVARRLARLRTPAVAGIVLALGLVGTAYGVVWLTGSGPP